MIVRRRSADVWDRERRAAQRRPPDERVVQADLDRPERVEQLLARAVRSTDLELLRLVVELEDRSALRAGELHGVLHDRRQHLLRIEARADRFANLAESVQLIDRPPELARPRVELLHQACVPYCDRALGSKSHRELDLAFRKRLDVVPPERDDCHDVIFALDRYADDGSEASDALPEALLFGVVFGIVGDVRRHHRPTLERDAPDESAGAKWQLTLCDHGSVLVGAA